MALLFCESFDGVETVAQLVGTPEGVRKWFRQTATPTATLVAGRTDRAISGGRFGGRRSFPARAHVFLGAAHFVPSGGTDLTSTLHLWQTGETVSTNNLNGSQSLRFRQNGIVEMRGEPSGVQVSSPAASFPLDDWFYAELELIAHPTAGECRIRINGLQVAAATGINTVQNAIGTISYDRLGVFWITAGTGLLFMVDDLYLVDDIGSVANDFLGDQIVEMIRPNSVGDLSEWVNSDGNQANNWNFVNERNIDDARYVNSTVVGARDIYQFQDLAADFGGLAGVQVTGRATHLGDPMNMSILAREGGFEAESSDVTLQNFFETPVRLFLDAPDGGQWTRAKVNAAQFGTRAKAP